MTTIKEDIKREYERLDLDLYEIDSSVAMARIRMRNLADLLKLYTRK